MEKITDILERRKKLYIGKCVIGEGIEEGKIWVENEIGEGMDAPIEDIENLISKYVHKNI